MNGYGRDRRRRLSQEDRQELYVTANGLCQRCGIQLDIGWHGAHLTAWSRSGSTSLQNMEAWCADCNLQLGPKDAMPVEAQPLREWQAGALDVILRQLYQTGAATVHAAPGAGKTHFAGVIFRRLREAGYVDRLVVVVPSVALVTQWKEALGLQQVQVDETPRDGYLEHPQTAGTVITYQSLPNSAAAQRTHLDQHPTLVVLDEVHHVGEQAAWGKAVRQMVGDAAADEVHPIAVLNMTGTLFRSSNKRRISTVRYQQTRVNDDGAAVLEAVADYSVKTVDLIGTALRAPDLYVYGAHAELVDLRTEELIAGDIADLDRERRSAVIRNSFQSREWTEGFAREAVRLLLNQQEALGREEPLKLLYVASNQTAARRAADALNAVTGDDFARLVVSDEPGALRTLRRAARDKKSCAIVAVKMVTEGFDCPAVSTIAYASNIVAELFVAQMMARAMRITGVERRQKMMLPAQILIPDHAELRKAFASALVNRMHILEERDDDQLIERVASGSLEARLPRFTLRDLSAPDFRNATVLGEEDGDVPRAEYEDWQQQLKGLNVPVTYTPRIAVAARRVQRFPRIYEQSEPTPVQVTIDPRAANVAQRGRLTKLSGWMQHHLEHDADFANVGMFQGHANDAAGIPQGGRDQASADQLATAAAWMTARIYEHCRRFDEIPPLFLEDA